MPQDALHAAVPLATALMFVTPLVADGWLSDWAEYNVRQTPRLLPFWMALPRCPHGDSETDTAVGLVGSGGGAWRTLAPASTTLRCLTTGSDQQRPSTLPAGGLEDDGVDLCARWPNRRRAKRRSTRAVPSERPPPAIVPRAGSLALRIGGSVSRLESVPERPQEWHERG